MYELEVRRGTVAMRAKLPEDQVADWARDALAAWGLRTPEALADGAWVERVAETGEYAADVDRARVSVKRAE